MTKGAASHHMQTQELFISTVEIILEMNTKWYKHNSQQTTVQIWFSVSDVKDKQEDKWINKYKIEAEELFWWHTEGTTFCITPLCNRAFLNNPSVQA